MAFFTMTDGDANELAYVMKRLKAVTAGCEVCINYNSLIHVLFLFGYTVRVEQTENLSNGSKILYLASSLELYQLFPLHKRI